MTAEAETGVQIGGLKGEQTGSLEIRECVPGIAWEVNVNPILERVRPDWAEAIKQLALEAPEKVIQGGAVHTSLASPDFHTRYHPTNGKIIAGRLPWLLELYQNDFRKILANLMGDETFHLGTDLAHSLNMNLTIRGPYEPHTDRNKGTFLLSATSLRPEEEGKTIIWSNNEFTDKLAIWTPQQGVALVFNGHYPHEVTVFKPASPDRVRLTVPGDYYNVDVEEVVDPEFNKKIGVEESSNALDK